MLTISSGHSASYLTDAVATGRENYYSGAVAAGEPPGRWYGAGAEALGLRGLVDAQEMSALYAYFVDPRDPGFRDPAAWSEATTLGHRGRAYLTEEELYRGALTAEPDATPERRAELLIDAGKRARRNVAFLDATFSVQKSITVLHTAFEAQEVAAQRAGDEVAAAAWAAHRQAVETAIWAGNNAALDYLAQHAGYSRIGHHGGAAGRFIDAHDFVVASFFQHDSRDHDPQLHIHNAILNRVQGADGIWRTLDSRGLHAIRPAASAVAERTTEEHLTRTLGVRFATRPDGKAREILGVPPEVMDLFSSRRRAITTRTRELVDAFETRYDRTPNALELDRLQRQATFATRNAKAHRGESVEQRLDRWDAALRAEVAGGLARVAQDVLALAGRTPTERAWSPEAVIETALADVQLRQATWTAPDLTRALSDALPDHLGGLGGEEVAALLDGLTTRAAAVAVPTDAERPGAGIVPGELRLADGRSAYEAPGRRRFTTAEHVRTEQALASAGTDHGARTASAAMVDQHLERIAGTGLGLGIDQAAAVRGILTSGARVECLVGPAGTGKSYVVGVIAHVWQADGGRVVGLASSQIATEVLADEGLAAVNIARWLATQHRLDAGSTAPDDLRWRVGPEDLVVIDESAMTTTADLAAVHQRVHDAGAKLLLTGDQRQLAAVGAGGGMDLIARVGSAHELSEARRFTHGWEAAASLGLREGDPSALTAYRKNGRLRDCGTVDDAADSAARAWLADTLAGHRSLLVVDTNEQAARLNAGLRAELIRLGRVHDSGVALGREGTWAGPGDVVQARSNAWHLAGHNGNRRGPVNRELLHVEEVGDDGGLTVTAARTGERMCLPAAYVTDHLTLGYAVTAHAAQGRTVDTAHLVVGPNTGAAALYVGLSRGRETNTGHVTTVTGSADARQDSTARTLHRNPTAVLAAICENAEPQRSALAQSHGSATNAASFRTAMELFADAAELGTAGRITQWLDELVLDGLLGWNERQQLAAEDGAATLTRLLRRAEIAGHDPREVLREATAARGLADARQLTNVLQHRIGNAVAVEPVGDRPTDWLPRADNPRWDTYLRTLAAAADTAADRLGELTARQQPQWAVEALGPVPASPDDRAGWVRRAGTVAAHRELTGHDDPATALGQPPKPGQAETTASWCAAWRALGRDQDVREEAELTDGRLRVRVRAWEREQAWAPRYVANELTATHEAAATHRADATLLRAEADLVADPSERERLLALAGEKTQLAERLTSRAADLTEADDIRTRWYTDTATTRAVAERAGRELARRGVQAEPEPVVTATEWLTAHGITTAAEDGHRLVRDPHDFDDGIRRREREQATPLVGNETPDAPLPESFPRLGKGATQDTPRVPTAEETAQTLARARAALAELDHRQLLDRTRAEDEARSTRIVRWHTDDRGTADARVLSTGRG